MDSINLRKGSHRAATGRERRADVSQVVKAFPQQKMTLHQMTYIGAPLPSGRGSVAAANPDSGQPKGPWGKAAEAAFRPETGATICPHRRKASTSPPSTGIR
jgi:hypothetical protein